MSEKIDFEHVKWGSFTKQFKQYKSEHPSSRIKDLEEFSNMLLRHPAKYKVRTLKRARFYLNVLLKKGGAEEEEDEELANIFDQMRIEEPPAPAPAPTVPVIRPVARRPGEKKGKRKTKEELAEARKTARNEKLNSSERRNRSPSPPPPPLGRGREKEAAERRQMAQEDSTGLERARRAPPRRVVTLPFVENAEVARPLDEVQNRAVERRQMAREDSTGLERARTVPRTVAIPLTEDEMIALENQLATDEREVSNMPTEDLLRYIQTLQAEQERRRSGRGRRTGGQEGESDSETDTEVDEVDIELPQPVRKKLRQYLREYRRVNLAPEYYDNTNRRDRSLDPSFRDYIATELLNNFDLDPVDWVNQIRSPQEYYFDFQNGGLNGGRRDIRRTEEEMDGTVTSQQLVAEEQHRRDNINDAFFHFLPDFQGYDDYLEPLIYQDLPVEERDQSILARQDRIQEGLFNRIDQYYYDWIEARTDFNFVDYIENELGENGFEDLYTDILQNTGIEQEEEEAEQLAAEAEAAAEQALANQPNAPPQIPPHTPPRDAEDEPASKRLRGGKISIGSLRGLLKQSYNSKRPSSYLNYEVDKSLSGQRVQVYKKKGTEEAVVVHRGTKGIHDIANDLKYAIGLDVKNTRRFKHAEDVQRKAEAKYGAENVSTLGHSLGSKIASTVGQKSKEIINLNKAVAPQDISKPISNKEINIRTQYDPVSFLLPFNPSKGETITIPSKSMDLLKEHSTDVLTRLPENKMVGGAIKRADVLRLIERARGLLDEFYSNETIALDTMDANRGVAIVDLPIVLEAAMRNVDLLAQLRSLRDRVDEMKEEQENFEPNISDDIRRGIGLTSIRLNTTIFESEQDQEAAEEVEEEGGARGSRVPTSEILRMRSIRRLDEERRKAFSEGHYNIDRQPLRQINADIEFLGEIDEPQPPNPFPPTERQLKRGGAYGAYRRAIGGALVEYSDEYRDQFEQVVRRRNQMTEEQFLNALEGLDVIVNPARRGLEDEVRRVLREEPHQLEYLRELAAEIRALQQLEFEIDAQIPEDGEIEGGAYISYKRAIRRI